MEFLSEIEKVGRLDMEGADTLVLKKTSGREAY